MTPLAVAAPNTRRNWLLDSQLCLYFPGYLTGDGKLKDESIYRNHGIISGATRKRLPSGLWYLSFDGDDYVANYVIAGVALPRVYPVTLAGSVAARHYEQEKHLFGM